MKLIIYHGSDHVIEKPEYDLGKPYNDYGRGFYCTEYIELAKEWACDETHGGVANRYELDLDGLHVLDLNGKDYCIMHWISILLRNRRFTLDTEIGTEARNYVLEHFPIDTAGYDVIKGYRANDSYFSFAKDFLQNGITVRRLSQVMKLGNLGNQIVLISPKAFMQIKYLGCEEAPKEIHFPLRKKRDELARMEYLSNRKGGEIKQDDILMIDIMRGGIQPNDPRLQ